MSRDLSAFVARLDALPTGYGEGVFDGRRHGTTLTISPDGRRYRLFAEELGGNARFSFNLYRLAGNRPALRPCEMPADKVIDFVMRYAPDGMANG